MKRRQFVRNVAAVSLFGPASRARGSLNSVTSSNGGETRPSPETKAVRPRAIAMWDFSWLERRWPGAGYEDWDMVLDQLKERGYNAVRIDAYPHLVGEDPNREYVLLPVWDQNMWGSPAVNRVRVQPALNEFIARCKARDIKVGLSSWYREDTDNIRMKIVSPAKMAENWIKTLDSIRKQNLLDALLYVDLCNEWPGDIWTPYFKNDPPEKTWGYWHTDKSMEFMRNSIAVLRDACPEIPLCFSFTGGEPKLYATKDLSFFDLLEHHTWMAQINDGEYDKKTGYKYDRFSSESYKSLAANYERVYREKPEYWRKILIDEIHLVADSAKAAGLPLITTECWAIVDFKDWPLLNWEIVKELGALGTETAAATGQWAAIATSNFCGPQFVGMWRDIGYHLKLTQIIKSSQLNAVFRNKLLAKRL